jgi:3-isopropylmalate dehydratase small subunit
MSDLIFTGRIWRFGDNFDTDQIMPGYALSLPRQKIRDQLLKGSARADIAAQLKPGDIIVAGNNFGCGSSREQAPMGLKDAGIAVIVARSFGRIFRRNAVNLGLAVLEAEIDARVEDGDTVTVDVRAGLIILSGGTIVHGRIPGLSVLATLAAGGLINKVRRELAEQKS